jgi:hypothetical protein
MKLFAMILSILLGSYSLVLAQSASSPANSAAPAQATGATTGSSSNSATGTGGSNSGASVNAAGSPGSNPTNALDDNRVAPTTGNPLIQSGKVK